MFTLRYADAVHGHEHEGSRGWGFWLGDLGELFTNREHYDTYVCTRCGKIELYLDGLGEEYRSESQ